MERKRAGSSVSFRSRRAFLLPCSASFSSFVSLMESTAISALAKMPFRAMSITCTKSKIPIESRTINLFLYQYKSRLKEKCKQKRRTGLCSP